MPKKQNIFAHYPFIKSKNRCRIRVDIGGDEHAITGRTPDEVDEKYLELMEAHNKGIIINHNISLLQYAREWYPVKTANLAPKSAGIYNNAINNHIAPFFQNAKLVDVKPLNIQKFMAEKTNLSRSSQTKILFTLSQIYDSAEQNGLIEKNPCKHIKAGGEQTKPKTPLTTEQQNILVTAVADTRANLFVLLCLFAGLRKEEALGLLWKNINLGNSPYIDVRHTVTYDLKGHPIHAEKLKSKAAYRTIPIPTILVHALRNAIATQTSDFIVPSLQTKGAMSGSSFRRMWDIAKAVTPFHIEPHILRHTYLTELCASGLDIKKIQYLAGHEDVNMTLRVYAHVKDNAPEQLTDVINNIFHKVPLKVQ